MRRPELEHAIRAATEIIAVDSIIVIGSQAILGSFTEHELPAEAPFPWDDARRNPSCSSLAGGDGVTVPYIIRSRPHSVEVWSGYQIQFDGMHKFGSPGMSVGHVDHPGARSCGSSSSIGPQESMIRARAAVAEWKP